MKDFGPNFNRKRHSKNLIMIMYFILSIIIYRIKKTKEVQKMFETAREVPVVQDETHKPKYELLKSAKDVKVSSNGVIKYTVSHHAQEDPHATSSAQSHKHGHEAPHKSHEEHDKNNTHGGKHGHHDEVDPHVSSKHNHQPSSKSGDANAPVHKHGHQPSSKTAGDVSPPVHKHHSISANVDTHVSNKHAIKQSQKH